MSDHQLVPHEVFELKNILYETLTMKLSSQDKDVSLVQDFKISPSMMKDEKINIYNVQSYVDNRQLTLNIVQALKVIDNLQQSFLTNSKQLTLSQEIKYEDKISTLEEKIIETNQQLQETQQLLEVDNNIEQLTDKVLSLFLQNGVTLDDFQRILKKKYVQLALDKHNTIGEAADTLGIQRTYMSRLKKDILNDNEV